MNTVNHQKEITQPGVLYTFRITSLYQYRATSPVGRVFKYMYKSDMYYTLFLLYEHIVFPAQAEYSYFSTDFRLEISL